MILLAEGMISRGRQPRRARSTVIQGIPESTPDWMRSTMAASASTRCSTVAMPIRSNPRLWTSSLNLCITLMVPISYGIIADGKVDISQTPYSKEASVQITTTTHPSGQVAADVLVVPFFHKEETLGEPLATLDNLLGGTISDARRWKEASGKPAETLLLHTQGKLSAQRVLIVGCGKTSEFTAERTRWYGSAAVRYLGQREARQVAIVLPGKLEPKAELAAIARGLVMGEYEPDQYKTEDKRESKVEGVTIVLPGPVEGTEEIVRRSTIVAEAANHARFLINEPGNKVTPTTLAQEARSLAEKYGLGVEVLDAEECRKLGMEAFLGVAQGSDVPPKLIFLRYTAPKESAITLGLVGKGITFDSGGISLKPAKDIHLMKHHMSGAAAVIATFEVIGQLRPAINVIGVVAATENMPGGRALKPGDILRAMNGKTIEVLNTDA